jgi:hypothetical protein
MRWTVPRRVAVGYLTSLVLVVLVGVLGVIAVGWTATRYRAAAAYDQQAEEALRAGFDAHEAEINHLRDLTAARPDYLQRRDSVLVQARRRLSRLRDAAETRSTRALWQEGLALLTQWEVASDSAIALMQIGFVVEASDVHDRFVVPARDAQAAVLRRAREQAEEGAVEALAAGRRTEIQMRWLVVVGGALAVALGILQSMLLNRAVASPLSETATALAADAAQILEATAQQTWSADVAAHGTAQALRRLEQAMNGRRTDATPASLREVEAALEDVRRAAERNSLATRHLQDVARSLNQRGLQLLELVSDADVPQQPPRPPADGGRLPATE